MLSRRICKKCKHFEALCMRRWGCWLKHPEAKHWTAFMDSREKKDSPFEFDCPYAMEHMLVEGKKLWW